MASFKKEIHNPILMIKEFWPNANIEHITYDPTLKKGDFSVIRQSGGDGTLSFTIEMLQEALIGIVRMESFCRSKEPSDWSKIKSIKYTVGSMRHATVYGMVKLKCSSSCKYQGKMERIRMPVKCEYI